MLHANDIERYLSSSRASLLTCYTVYHDALDIVCGRGVLQLKKCCTVDIKIASEDTNTHYNTHWFFGEMISDMSLQDVLIMQRGKRSRCRYNGSHECQDAQVILLFLCFWTSFCTTSWILVAYRCILTTDIFNTVLSTALPTSHTARTSGSQGRTQYMFSAPAVHITLPKQQWSKAVRNAMKYTA